MTYVRNTLIGLMGMLLAACAPHPQAQSNDTTGSAKVGSEDWHILVQSKVRPVNVPYL